MGKPSEVWQDLGYTPRGVHEDNSQDFVSSRVISNIKKKLQPTVDYKSLHSADREMLISLVNSQTGIYVSEELKMILEAGVKFTCEGGFPVENQRYYLERVRSEIRNYLFPTR